MIKIGSTTANNVMVGSTQIREIRQGTTLLWQNATEQILKFTATLGQWNPNNIPSYNYYGAYIYQGAWSTYGNNRGLATFGQNTIKNALSGATVLDGSTITVRRRNTSHGYASEVPVILCGTTTYSYSTSGSQSAPAVTKTYGQICALNRGATKTVTLPKQAVLDLQNGTIQSLMFYSSSGSNTHYNQLDSVSISLKVLK